MYRKIFARIEPDANLIAFHTQNCDRNVVAYHDAFADPSSKNEHGEILRSDVLFEK
jgi:hypothetical protein